MPETRNDELYCALKHNGYPDDFCREIAYRQMNTDFTATRMLGYLYRVTSPRAEDVVDEMLANLTVCGFGIYMIHYFFTGPGVVLMRNIGVPVPLQIPAAAIVAFGVSWLLVVFIRKISGKNAKYIVG